MSSRRALVLVLLLLCPSAASAQLPDTAVQWLGALDLGTIEQGWGRARADSTVDGRGLRIAGRSYARGVGSHADAIARIRLDRALRFVADVGVDDEANASDGKSRGSVRFTFLLDRKKAFETAVLRGGDAPVHVDLDLRGARELWLVIDGADAGIDYDHADWADARITYTAGAKAPALYRAAPRAPIALTPAASARPRINGAALYGVGTGHPLIYRVPVSGERPVRITAVGLPPGVTLNAATGVMSGAVQRPGRYEVTLRATNARGSAERKWTLVVGQGLALTPPMGWNSWNVWGCNVDAAKIRAAADVMVSSGLADHGWGYINIDDCWMRKPGPDARDPKTHAILTNEKFPDMKGLADYVHAKGLKLGIYIGPNEHTCAGYEASIGHEREDLEQFAKWGIDYVKYDWCASRRDSVPEKYAKYGTILKTMPRDIVYSLCEYGWNDVWTWGAQAGGNLWRTTGDITDTWPSMSGIGFRQDAMAPYAGPGHWNDPDMLVVGQVGWGTPRPTRLTPDEQYTHISLWSLLASPLLIGADMTRLDAFTKSLLTNDEVLAINQDPLGKQATRVAESGAGYVYARPLADGSWAVGLFNTDWDEQRMRLDFSALGLSGAVELRDVWRQLPLGMFERGYDVIVPSHGVVLLRISAARVGAGVGRAGAAATSPAGNRKVLLIGIDGLRPDVWARVKTPNLDALKRAGVFTDSAWTRMPTVSGPGWSNILTGAWPERHGVTGNTFSGRRYDAYPDFLTRLERLDPAYRTYAIADWLPLIQLEKGSALLSPAIDLLVPVNGDSLGYTAADARTTELASVWLRSGDVDAAFVYLGDVDEIGHEKGTLSPEYRTAIETADAQVGTLMAALRARPHYAQEDWLVLVTTDHGRRDDGDHGGDSVQERRVFLLLSGPAVDRSARIGGARLVDVAPTALAHLGVKLDPAWRLDGRAIGLRAGR